MQKRFYTLVFAHGADGRLRKVKVPGWAIPLVLVAAMVGAGTILAGAASYAHLLLKVTDYNQLRAEWQRLQVQNSHLRASNAESNERLATLEGLANEVASTYGLMRLRQTPFGTIENVGARPEEYEFSETLARFRYLQNNASAVGLYASGARPLPGQDLSRLTHTPSLWPVRGRLVGGFGDRVDPFSGEGAFHAGVDISADYGQTVQATADGFVIWVGPRSGSGRLVVVDHGAGITTWYAHLSAYRVRRGQSVARGDVVGYVGTSGRSTGPHLHYEVRLYDAPVNPWRFLRQERTITAGGAGLMRTGGG